MTEQELRTLVREVLAQRAGAQVAHPDQPPLGCGSHPSHAVFSLPVGADAEGPCIIEPAVMCTHCGYCKSYGH